MEQPFGETILHEKLRKVRVTLLNHLWNLMALLQDSNNHFSLLKSFQLQINQMRKDLRSWPTLHEIKMAVRRLDDILGVVDNVLDQMGKPNKINDRPMYASMDIKIKIKAKYIK